MGISEYLTTNNITTVVVVLIIFLILAFVPIKNWLKKRKEAKQTQELEQTTPEFQEYVPPDYIAPAPEFIVPDYNYPNGTQNAVEIMKNTLKKLDQELQENSRNMQKVLQGVVSMETDIRNKMKSYYEMDKDLRAKEQLLRYNLDALRKAKISIANPNACPVCGTEMLPLEGTNKYVCPKCYKSKR